MENFEFITWFGHASFMFTDTTSGTTIAYVDPFDLKQENLEKADIIFITHAHYDHSSSNDVTKILKNDSMVVAASDVLEKVHVPKIHHFPVVPNNSYAVKEMSFSTVPAYNIQQERLSYHPRENNWVGYVLLINNKKNYHAGDTDFIPEMNSLKTLNLDIAMLPIGGTYTMDAHEAAEAANAISAKITIPMHYKRLLGDKSKEAEETFKKEVTNSEVMFLEEKR